MERITARPATTPASQHRPRGAFSRLQIDAFSLVKNTGGRRVKIAIPTAGWCCELFAPGPRMDGGPWLPHERIAAPRRHTIMDPGNPAAEVVGAVQQRAPLLPAM